MLQPDIGFGLTGLIDYDLTLSAFQIALYEDTLLIDEDFIFEILLDWGNPYFDFARGSEGSASIAFVGNHLEIRDSIGCVLRWSKQDYENIFLHS